MIDYGHLYRKWFMLGAFILVGGCTLQILSCVAAASGRDAKEILCLIRFVQFCGIVTYIVWIGYGYMWRFGEMGKIASGDYIDENTKNKELYMIISGKFMKLYLLIATGVLALPCVFLILAIPIVICINRKKRREYESSEEEYDDEEESEQELEKVSEKD